MDFGGDDVFFSFFFSKFFSFFAFVFSKGQIVPQKVANHPSFPHDETNKKKEERRRQDLNLRTRCVFDF